VQAYNGGNKHKNETTAMAEAMAGIRQDIFARPNGTVDSQLLTLLLATYI
jgi:hypothetical protein